MEAVEADEVAFAVVGDTGAVEAVGGAVPPLVETGFGLGFALEKL